LAGTIASTALASGAVAGSTTLTLMKLMSMTTVKVSVIGALVVAGVAVPAWQQTRLQRAQAENAQLRAKETALRTQATELAALRNEAERLRKTGDDPAELEQLRQWKMQTQPELLRLRGMAGVARRANLEAEQLRAQLAKQAGESGTNPASGAMADGYKRAFEQQAESRLSRLTAGLHLTPDQVQAVREILLRQADANAAAEAENMRRIYTGKYDKEALDKLKKDVGDPDPQIKALLTPDQTAAYPNYQQEEHAHDARGAANNGMLQLRNAVDLTAEQEDRAFAALYQAALDRILGTTKPTTKDETEAEVWRLDQNTKALETVLTPTQFESYRQQQANLAKLIRDLSSKPEVSGGSK
jgi:hypothetical protein